MTCPQEKVLKKRYSQVNKTFCVWLKTIHCVECAYPEAWIIILWSIGTRMVRPNVTQPMSKSCPSTTSGIFSFTNLQEEVGIGITTLSREYPLKRNSSLYLKKTHESKPVLPDGLSSKSLPVPLPIITTYFQQSKIITANTLTQIIFSIQTTH